ncbi:MAG: type II secretion system protein [Candidatus Omnitrophica bacterium]|nr:type II secretion system protein [Candidatus Omnitrophota bacterium]
MRTNLENQKGFTLVELAVGAVVLTIAILTTAFSILNLQGLSELSKEKVIAVADANRVLEAMRDTANTSVSALQSTNWTTWAATNVVGTKGSNEVQLPQETVTAVIASGNPAQVTLTLSWNHKQRTYSYQVITLMTDRT